VLWKCTLSSCIMVLGHQRQRYSVCYSSVGICRLSTMMYVYFPWRLVRVVIDQLDVVATMFGALEEYRQRIFHGAG
jgi:hypothetical protein